MVALRWRVVARVLPECGLPTKNTGVSVAKQLITDQMSAEKALRDREKMATAEDTDKRKAKLSEVR